MRKIVCFVASLFMASVLASPAQADTILFDTNGAAAGGVVEIDLMDLKPGNAITTFDFASGTATVLFQANLGTTSLTDSEGNNITNFTSCSAGTTCFTFTAAVDVLISEVNGDTIVLSLDPNGDQNAFYMYSNTTQQGNDLTGQCFASANVTCGGTLILTGEFLNFDANFTNDGTLAAELDNFGNNNYPGVSTIEGGGEFNGDILITSALDAWFPNLVDGSSLFIASSEQHIAYDQANPSACFSSDGLQNCNTPGVGAVGPINGNSTNSIMTQTDANIAFQQPASAVPEPASLLLLGSGLLGAAAARRRRARKN